jgi:sterol O-acyltransferase
MAVNGYLQEVDKKATTVKNRLQKLTTNVGGWDQAVSDAQDRRDELDQQEITPSETPALIKGNSSYFGSEPAAIALRNRLQAVQVPNGLKRDNSSASLHSEASSVTHPPAPAIPIPPIPKPHPLVDHVDKAISSLAVELSELEAELTSTGQNHVRWPANLTWANYVDYQFLPTLVYELEYPRTDRCDFSLV